ncbi:MAG TPA: hypothetical protein VMF30_13970 [Pirellulales bacterium]|nr:hypothetical protein [Pirellulales bacterium]
MDFAPVNMASGSILLPGSGGRRSSRGGVPARPAAGSMRRFARALSISLVAGLVLSSGVVHAGLSDWLSSSDAGQKQQPQKHVVKKAGIGQSTKKPTSTASRMFNSITSAPRKVATNTMSALVPSKKTAPSKSRTVPRKLVSNEKPSMLKNLFAPPPKKQPMTVTEWVAQPRPKP